MEKARKQEILQAYKEATVAKGVFAVRCTATGETWIGSSANLGQQQNRIWFMLRQGSHTNPKAQAAWRTHGEDAFVFEILETIDEESVSPAGLADLLKDKAREWREALGAQKLAG